MNSNPTPEYAPDLGGGVFLGGQEAKTDLNNKLNRALDLAGSVRSRAVRIMNNLEGPTPHTATDAPEAPQPVGVEPKVNELINELEAAHNLLIRTVELLGQA